MLNQQNKGRMISLPCLISLWSLVQEGNHSSMWAISQGNLAMEIIHFERMGLNGLSSNSLILTRGQAFKGREGNSLLVHAHYHTLTACPLSYSCLLSVFLFFLSFLLYLSLSCFVVLPPPPSFFLCTAMAPFILPAMSGFYHFTP